MKLYSQSFYHEKIQLNRFNVINVICFCFITTSPPPSPSDWDNTLIVQIFVIIFKTRQKCSQDAADADFTIGCNSAPPHPVRAPVNFRTLTSKNSKSKQGYH